VHVNALNVNMFGFGAINLL